MYFRQFRNTSKHCLGFIIWNKGADLLRQGRAKDSQHWDYTSNNNKTVFKLELVW